MKDRLLYGLFPGLSAPFIIILLFWLFRFHDLPLSQFIHQAIALKVQFKLISVGVFFADLGLFYLFLHLNKNNASKGVILAVLFFFFTGFAHFTDGILVEQIGYAIKNGGNPEQDEHAFGRTERIE